MARYVHVVAEGEDDGLRLHRQFTSRRQDQRLGVADIRIDRLERGDGECGGLTCTGLRLGNDIATTGDGQDGTLLNGRRLFKVYISTNR